MTDPEPGIYHLLIQLKDEDYTSIQKSLTLTFEDLPEIIKEEIKQNDLKNETIPVFKFIPPPIKNITSAKKPKFTGNYVMMQIDEIDTIGLLTVKFNKRMNTNYSSPFLNKTYINIYIEEYIDNLQINWTVKSFVGQYLQI